MKKQSLLFRSLFVAFFTWTAVLQAQVAPKPSIAIIDFDTRGYTAANQSQCIQYIINEWGADLQFYRHEKEVKSFSQDPQARAYYYGKENSLFLFRPGLGMNHEFAEKIRKSGVQLSYFWAIGPDFGFVKPVYLQILYPSTIGPIS